MNTDGVQLEVCAFPFQLTVVILFSSTVVLSSPLSEDDKCLVPTAQGYQEFLN